MLNLIIWYFLFLLIYFGFSYIYYIKDFNETNRRQKTEKDELEKIYKKILPNVFFNIVILSPLYVYYLVSLFDISTEFNLYLLPNDLFYMLMGTELLFYVLHRIAHIPIFYKLIHKKHHELTAPVALGALYCYPSEMILVNLPSTILPGLIIGVPFYSLALYSLLATHNTVVGAHGGYKKNICNKNGCRPFHDIHHEKFNGNYGIGYFMDELFNTSI